MKDPILEYNLKAMSFLSDQVNRPDFYEEVDRATKSLEEDGVAEEVHPENPGIDMIGDPKE